MPAAVDVTMVGALPPAPLLDELTGPAMQVMPVAAAADDEHPAQAVCEQLPDG